MSAPHGIGEQPLLRYAGQSLPQNFVSFGLDSETTYDDSVLNNDAHRRSDTVCGFGPRLTLGKGRKALSFLVDFRPDFLLYQHTRTYDQINRTLQFDVNYRISSHLGLKVRIVTSYRNGIFEPHWGGLPALKSVQLVSWDFGV